MIIFIWQYMEKEYSDVSLKISGSIQIIFCYFYIVYLERIEGIDDLKLAVSLKQNKDNRRKLEEQLKLLEGFLGK